MTEKSSSIILHSDRPYIAIKSTATTATSSSRHCSVRLADLEKVLPSPPQQLNYGENGKSEDLGATTSATLMRSSPSVATRRGLPRLLSPSCTNTTVSNTTAYYPTLPSIYSNFDSSNDRSTTGDSQSQGEKNEKVAGHSQRFAFVGQQEEHLQGELSGADGIMTRANEPRHEKRTAGESVELQSPHPALAPDSPKMKGAVAGERAYKLPSTSFTTVTPLNGVALVSRSNVKRETSLAIVPYINPQEKWGSCGGDGAVKMPEHPLFDFTFEEQQGLSFDPPSMVRPTQVLPFGAIVRDARSPSPTAGMSSKLRRSLVVDGGRVSKTSSRSGSLRGQLVAAQNAGRAREQRNRSEWVVLSAEQVEEAAKKLHEETEKNKTLESVVGKHKRDRVLIYDAAMKQAKKWEEDGVNEVKQTFQREQSVMKAEVDQELSKINDLYHERSRDYAQMVSDECEGEVSKAVADLRKSWVQQKKTITQLVRDGGQEDRKVAVITRAVMEQMQEERKDELASIRAEICSDVKMEFESREVVLRDTLQSEFQEDIDGQLLLADIRHQKEMDELRTELTDGGTLSAEAAAGTIVVYKKETLSERSEVGGISNGPSTTSPSLPRCSLQQKLPTRVASNDKNIIPPIGKAGLARKLPVFKTPVQKVSLVEKNKTAKGKLVLTASEATSKPRSRIKKASVPPSVGSGLKIVKNQVVAQDTVAKKSPDGTKASPSDEEESQLDEGITSALMVSPTKAIPGMVVTPSTETDGGCSDVEPPRLKKRAKRLFSGYH